METRFKTVKGKKVCYWEGGDGETLLLLHGWGRPLLKTDEVLRLLARNFHVIAPDFPGYGGTELLEKPHTIEAYKDFTLDLIGKLKLKGIYLAGSSMGSLVALSAAVEKPQLFKKLILIGFTDDFARDLPLVGKKGAARLSKLLTSKSICWFLTKPAEGVAKRLPAFAVACFEGAEGIRDRVGDLARESKSLDSQVMLENITDILNHSYEDKVRNLTIPTAIICGGKDRFVIPKKCETPTGECPGFKRIAIKGGRHAILTYRPEELTQAITGFIHS